ncbi:nickel insertion protein [Methanocella sp. MCL-LM]|uniref:nickel insertion protein n=1 Tax=Methanocella sp. MCL-LM TaxID=3412035 RepID=UPI003C737449
MATVDDVPAEVVPYIIERVMDAGANNIHVVNAITKKNRMEYLVYVDVNEDRVEAIATLLALEFGTIGVKAFRHEHIMMPFDVETKSVQITAAGKAVERRVKVKYIRKDGRVLSLKAEYEDVKALALALSGEGVTIPLSRLKTLIEAEAFSRVLEQADVRVTITDDLLRTINYTGPKIADRPGS